MGSLVTIDQLERELGLEWYFDEFEYAGNGKTKPKLPCGAFPVSLAINKDLLSGYHKIEQLKFIINSWVVENIRDKVLLTRLEKDYFHNYEGYDSDYGTQVSWGYYLFHFSDDAEAISFKLRFAEYISTIEPYDKTRIPNYIQRYMKNEVREDTAFAQILAKHNKSVKAKNHVDEQKLLDDIDRIGWDGRTTLIFKKSDGEEVEDEQLFALYSAAWRKREAKNQLAHILHMHSTFIPSS